MISHAADAAPGFEEVVARAARLGVTPEKVLEEYARIAFADVRHIADWDEEGLHVKASDRLSEADVAPIHEISGRGSAAVHVKLYDKKAALDAIARHLGMFTPSSQPEDEDRATVEDVREELARRLARLAHEEAEE